MINDHHYNQYHITIIFILVSGASMQDDHPPSVLGDLRQPLLRPPSRPVRALRGQHLTLEQSSHLALSPDQGKYSLPGSLLGLLDHSGCAAPRLRLRHPHLGEADVRQEEVVEYLKFYVPSYHLTIYAADAQSRRSGRCASSCCSPGPASPHTLCYLKPFPTPGWLSQ